MGGEGSMQHMISILKSNKELVGTRNHFFSRKRNFKRLRESYRRAEERLAKGPEATREELKQIRERIIKDQKERSYKIGLAMLAIVATGILALTILWSIN